MQLLTFIVEVPALCASLKALKLGPLHFLDGSPAVWTEHELAFLERALPRLESLEVLELYGLDSAQADRIMGASAIYGLFRCSCASEGLRLSRLDGCAFGNIVGALQVCTAVVIE